jgi:3-dehydroquinate dehydratase-2
MNILVVNGPNLNMVGVREPEIYGERSYADLKKYLRTLGKKYRVGIKIFQSNCEGKIIDAIHRAYRRRFDGIIINPGALAHYSHALRDAIAAVGIKTAEVHLTDIGAREEFRRRSVIRDACVGFYSGLGFEGYERALKLLIGDEK